MMPGMNDLQAALVANRISELAQDGAALRAERQRDHLRDHAAAGTDPFDHRADLAPRRVRIGRWLVAFGEAIAGSRVSSDPALRGAALAATKVNDDPCNETHDRWASAA